MNIVMYGNGSSLNHGCEAIIRGTKALLPYPLTIMSEAPEEDRECKIGNIANICAAKDGKDNKLQFLKAYLDLKVRKNYSAMDILPYLHAIKCGKGIYDIALSAGGDNYCYGNERFYALLNSAYNKAGMKTVLWGCSVEPGILSDQTVINDLKNYSLIVARESLTYEAIRKTGANIQLSPDPAFYINPEPCNLDERFNTHSVVGINLSPMIISNEKNHGIAYENYKELIRYILERTDYDIALIPHVVWKKNDDRVVMRKLYDEFNHDNRIIFVEDHLAPQLKYIISKCSMFIGARTHATIAAYSTKVPTLVVGYSIKARGIATDLFGTDERYVLPVQNLEGRDDLTNAFIWLQINHESIKDHLDKFMPGYIEKGKNVGSLIEQLV